LKTIDGNNKIGKNIAENVHTGKGFVRRAYAPTWARGLSLIWRVHFGSLYAVVDACHSLPNYDEPDFYDSTCVHVATCAWHIIGSY
jgi:hypothetical protein